jgi:tetratricopeptide (TPR) repeat protein
LEKITPPKAEGETRQIAKAEEPPKSMAAKSMAAHLERAVQLCSQGDYDGAFRENQQVLSLSGKNPPGDRALFNMALVYAASGNPKKDYEKALLVLQRMIRDYPQSPLVEEAKTWAAVLQENEKSRQELERYRKESEKLRQVIEQSKEVDLLVDKKKREKER